MPPLVEQSGPLGDEIASWLNLMKAMTVEFLMTKSPSKCSVGHCVPIALGNATQFPRLSHGLNRAVPSATCAEASTQHGHESFC